MQHFHPLLDIPGQARCQDILPHIHSILDRGEREPFGRVGRLGNVDDLVELMSKTRHNSACHGKQDLISQHIAPRTMQRDREEGYCL